MERTPIPKYKPDLTSAAAWREYDGAAKSLAEKGLTGKEGDPLPDGLTRETLALINADPLAFQQRVTETAYALAMGRTADRNHNH